MVYGFNDDKSKAEVCTKDELLNIFYPVGSIYETTDNDFVPDEVWGGTWQRIKGRFLLGSSDEYGIGVTGGSADAVVVKHKHSFTLGSLTMFTVGGSSANTYKVGGTPAPTNYTEEEGEAGTGKNMPPYLVVNIWKRTA